MESKATFKMPPVETYQHEGLEAHDVVRLEKPMSDMLGAVVVGPYHMSDCYQGIGEIQAGNKDPKAPLDSPDPSGDDYKDEW